MEGNCEQKGRVEPRRAREAEGKEEQKVLSNTSQEEKACRVVERIQGARRMGHRELAGAGIFRAGSINRCVNGLRQ